VGFVEAIKLYELNLTYWQFETDKDNWAMTQENWGYLFEFSATRSDGPKQELTTALKYFDAALEVYDPVHTSFYHTKCTAARDEVLATLAELDKTP
jgi:hypothetical protein